MWFPLGFQHFMVKNHLSDDFCDIFVSDFKCIWYKSMSANEFFSICQSLNPLFEGSVQKLRDVSLSLLKDKSVKKEIKEEMSSIFLKLQSNILGVKFQFQVLLHQGDGEMLYKELMVPLLLVLMNTKSREKKLIEIIKDKDKEINDYKQENGFISNCFTREPFNNEEFDFQDSSLNSSFDPSCFRDCMNAELLSIKTLPKVKTQEQLFEKKLEGNDQQNDSVIKNNTKALFYKDKTSNGNKDKSCILLNNQIIKKRKKQNDGFRIKI